MAFEILIAFLIFCFILYSHVLRFKLSKSLIRPLRKFLVCKIEIIKLLLRLKKLKIYLWWYPGSSVEKHGYHYILLWRHRAGQSCAVLYPQLQEAPSSAPDTTTMFRKNLNIFSRPQNRPSHIFIPWLWFVKPRWILKKKGGVLN